MWKFQEFCVSEILREINFVDSRSAKTTIFAILGAVNFVHLVNFSLQNVPKNSQKSEFRASKCGKMADFALQELSTNWPKFKLHFCSKLVL